MFNSVCFRWMRVRAWCIGILWGIVAWTCAGQSQAAMEIQGIQNGTAPASNYDRFDNSPSWIGNPANWPGGAPPMAVQNPWMGVGRDATAGRWATLISPSFVVSANHFAPGNGDTIQFFYTNNPSGPVESRTLVASEWLQASVPGDQGDVWIGKLSAPITDMPSYPILSLPGAGSDAYGGLGISTFGLSSDIPGTATSVRLGRNVIWKGTAAMYTETAGSSENYAYTFSYSNPGVGADESQIMTGDSGGPSFFLYGGGTPALLGLHWFNNDPMDTVSADTWLTNYVTDLQTGMNQLGNAGGEKVKTIAPVPGDFNLDGKRTAADSAAMSAALGNLSKYETTHGMNDAYLNSIGDLNGDGKVDTADYNILNQTVGRTQLGDTNGDGVVDLRDLANVLNDFGVTGQSPLGDTNGDGIVNLTDFNNVSNNFGRSVGSLNSVPEPAGWVLLVGGGLVLLGWGFSSLRGRFLSPVPLRVPSRRD
ncbi:MAG TPA: hypothetical protein VGJ04_03120 [Pirellulales bacterium]